VLVHSFVKLADADYFPCPAALGALGLIFEVIIILADVIGRADGVTTYGSQGHSFYMTMVILGSFGAMALCGPSGRFTSRLDLSNEAIRRCLTA